ncbi:MAG: response regulator [Deltaproteobacteria bacterium]|nr:response regulator [Deltaproteobacteria bacterium]
MEHTGDDDQLNILVIDDEEEVTRVIAEAFLKQGHMVATAGSAEEGLELLPYQTFQVAFIDHHLPGMEGLVLGGYLRRNNPHMQVALVTGEPEDRLEQESAELGLRYIIKPFVFDRLQAVVDAYLESAQEREQQRAARDDPDFHPRFAPYADELAPLYDLPGVPERIADGIRRRLTACLNELASPARYNERDRVAALCGLLTAKLLGIGLPRRKDGTTPYEHYDALMQKHHRRCEFGS